MLIYPIGLSVCLFIWEYISIRTSRFLAPSKLILELALWSKWTWYRVGQALAYVSSFLIYLKLDKLIEAIAQLTVSIWTLLTSGFEMIHGYEAVALTYEHPKVIWAGSITLVALILCGLVRYYRLNEAWFRRHAVSLIFGGYFLMILIAMGYTYWKEVDCWSCWWVEFGLLVLGLIGYRYRQGLLIESGLGFYFNNYRVES